MTNFNWKKQPDNANFAKKTMKGLLIAILSVLPLFVNGQKLFRYNCADTLVSQITEPYFVSSKLVYFDSSYVVRGEGGNTMFNIGKVCQQFGCEGEFESSGAIQAGWWLVENKIIICFLTPKGEGAFQASLKIWRYDASKKRFVLIT